LGIKGEEMFPSILLIAAIMGGPQIEAPQKEESYVVVYPIQDLEMVIPNYTNVPQIDLNAVLNGQHGGSPFTNNQPQNTNNPKNPKAIMDLIENLVEPEAWEDNGGDEASIRYWNGNLIIKAPKRIHDQIK
jgi:hypothetical protein